MPWRFGTGSARTDLRFWLPRLRFGGRPLPTEIEVTRLKHVLLSDSQLYGSNLSALALHDEFERKGKPYDNGSIDLPILPGASFAEAA